jgi:hypothetical protein
MIGIANCHPIMLWMRLTAPRDEFDVLTRDLAVTHTS